MKKTCAQLPTPSASLIPFGGRWSCPDIHPGKCVSSDWDGGRLNACAALPTTLLSPLERVPVIGNFVVCSLEVVV